MIKKMNGYDELQETEVLSGGGLPKGIYPLQIKNVNDVSDREYLEVMVDIVKNPNYSGYFKKLADANENGRYPNIGIWRASYKESAAKFFKAFITAVQKSNPNYVWDWNEKSLIGKYCVGVFDEEEYEYNDEVKVSVRLREIRSIDAYKNNEIKMPGLKKLKKVVSVAPVNVEIPDGQLPF